MVSSIERFHCIQDSQLGPNGVLHREVPLYLHGIPTLHVYVCMSGAELAPPCMVGLYCVLLLVTPPFICRVIPATLVLCMDWVIS